MGVPPQTVRGLIIARVELLVVSISRCGVGIKKLRNAGTVQGLVNVRSYEVDRRPYYAEPPAYSISTYRTQANAYFLLTVGVFIPHSRFSHIPTAMCFEENDRPKQRHSPVSLQYYTGGRTFVHALWCCQMYMKYVHSALLLTTRLCQTQHHSRLLYRCTNVLEARGTRPQKTNATQKKSFQGSAAVKSQTRTA